MLDAVILYGSAARGEYLPDRSNLNLLLILAQHDLAPLRRYAKAHRRWAKERIVIPLFLTEAEMRASRRLFPVEYLDLNDHHVVLVGRDPFPQLPVETGTLAEACARECRGNLLRLRQRIVEGRDHAEAQAILLPLSLTALLPCLRAWCRVEGHPAPKSTEALLADSTWDGVETAALLEVWHLKKGLISPGPAELPRLFERYLLALQRLADRMDPLKVEP
jgi:hypothetical protein